MIFSSQIVNHNQISEIEKKVSQLSEEVEKKLFAENPLRFETCDKCGTNLIDSGIYAGEKYYHDLCFTCVICQKPLKDMSYYTVNGKNYCEIDYLFIGFKEGLHECDACHNLILDKIIELQHSKFYHPHCFCCAMCKVSLDGKPYIEVNSGEIEPKIKICLSHYYISAQNNNLLLDSSMKK